MKTIKIISLSIMAYLIATAVVLSSVHAREIAATGNGAVPVDTTHSMKVRMDDVAAKAIADLHSHVDKTVLKPFVKSMSDQTQTILIRQRQTSVSTEDTARPLSVIVMEMLLMFRLTYATVLAR